MERIRGKLTIDEGEIEERFIRSSGPGGQAKAAELVTPRRKTRPTEGSRERRLEGKRLRGETKRVRKPVSPSGE